MCITVYRGPVYDMCGSGLAAKLSSFNGGGLEVTATPLSYGYCKSLLDCMVNPASN